MNSLYNLANGKFTAQKLIRIILLILALIMPFGLVIFAIIYTFPKHDLKIFLRYLRKKCQYFINKIK